jgi:hypothetical protein
MIDVVEVLQHWHAGRPKSVVASSLGVDLGGHNKNRPLVVEDSVIIRLEAG